MSTRFGQRLHSQQHNRALIGVSFALFLCAATTAAVFLFNAALPAPAQSAVAMPVEETALVLVSRRDIEPGEALQNDQFQLEERPRKAIHQFYARDFEQIKRQYARAFIPAGEPLHMKQIVSSRSAGPISPTIPDGFRAVTIRVNDITSVDGLVRPGEVVDVAWIHSVQGQQALRTIVQNARVIGADRNVDQAWKPSMPVPGTVTLQVPVQDSRVIQLCAQGGTLSLALRGPNGKSDPEVGSVLTIPEIMNGSNTAPQKADCRGRLRMGNGNNRQEYCVRPDGSLELIAPQVGATSLS